MKCPNSNFLTVWLISTNKISTSVNIWKPIKCFEFHSRGATRNFHEKIPQALTFQSFNRFPETTYRSTQLTSGRINFKSHSGEQPGNRLTDFYNQHTDWFRLTREKSRTIKKVTNSILREQQGILFVKNTPKKLFNQWTDFHKQYTDRFSSASGNIQKLQKNFEIRFWGAIEDFS
jgi:hypothetical protein